MHVLISGHLGYIGPAMVRALQDASHTVAGLDTGLFEGCQLENSLPIPTIARDLRDVTLDDLRGFDAIVHLANLSNDPLGALDPALTHDINVDATVRLAELAREAGVKRFLNSSSCSVYGAAVEEWVDEATPTRPVTAYGESKIAAERGLAALADDSFCVVSMRNATAFGYSPNLRTDLVVNDLVAGAHLRGEIRLNSDGSAWRPLVHIRDISQAFRLALTAPQTAINGEVFNVGSTDQNYRVIEVAQTVAAQMPGAELIVPAGAGADRRSYRVRFDKVKRLLPDFVCQYDLDAGVRELISAYRRVPLTATDGSVRLMHLRRLLDAGELDATLRRRPPAAG
jgi:nucleoside-diphosphate-sugar epimerase